MTEKILVIGPAWIGDMVMAQSLFKHLKNIFPGCVIDLIAPGWSGALVSRMPEIQKFIALQTKHGEFSFLYRWRLGKKLRSEQYTRAYVLPTTWKSAIPAFSAKIPLRIGYFGEMRFGLINKKLLMKKSLDKMVKRYLALSDNQVYTSKADFNLADYPYPRLAVDKENQKKLINSFGLDATKKTIALLPGAEYGASKRWPAEYFATLAEKLVEQDFQIIVIGGEKEFELGETIAENRLGVYNLCSKTSLTDAIDILAFAQISIGNDSGLMHISSAVDINVFAIYGATPPLFAPPLTAKGKIFWKNLECSPCKKRECPFGHYQCLTKITPQEIFQAVQLLN